MIIYKISLRAGTDAKSFTDFMHDKYFPAIHKGATRVGKVTSLVLLESDSESLEFYWLVGWNGLRSDRNIRIDNEEVTTQFEAYKADLELIGFFKEVAAWPEEDL